jgi:uncharacterized protein DUF4430
MPVRLRSVLTLLSAAAAGLACGGCGLGAGRAPTAVQLLVTRDFGARVLHRSDAPRLGGQDTAMSVLMRNETVTTRFGGGFVESVDTLAGGQEAGRPVDWFYYVNGVEATKGAAATNVHPGDHIWWDRHDWSQTNDVPAVVGSFPEPFLNGLDGKRLPVRVECASVSGYACRTVEARLHALGVPAALAGIGSGGEPETLRVMVGPWSRLAGDPATELLARGPRASGVYARFGPSGQTLTLLDQDGRSTATLAGGAGLIAATREAENAPIWFVSGTDPAGVDLAARQFDQATLAGHFAVALSASATTPLPVKAP